MQQNYKILHTNTKWCKIAYTINFHFDLTGQAITTLKTIEKNDIVEKKVNKQRAIMAVGTCMHGEHEGKKEHFKANKISFDGKILLFFYKYLFNANTHVKRQKDGERGKKIVYRQPKAYKTEPTANRSPNKGAFYKAMWAAAAAEEK